MSGVENAAGAEFEYYERLHPDDTFVSPWFLLRRHRTADGPVVDEVLGADGEWHASDMLARLERGELSGEQHRLHELIANIVITELRERYQRLAAALAGQARGEVSLRLAEPVTRRGLEAWERDEVVAFLTGAPLVSADGGVRTDGKWVWDDAVIALARQGAAPEPGLIYHIGSRLYRFPESVSAEVLERAKQLIATRAAGAAGRVREALPDGRPVPTQAERLQALAAWHDEWQRKHEGRTPLRPDPERADQESDYGVHYVDVEASSAADWEFTRRARQIMGRDPETGEYLDE